MKQIILQRLLSLYMLHLDICLNISYQLSSQLQYGEFYVLGQLFNLWFSYVMWAKKNEWSEIGKSMRSEIQYELLFIFIHKSLWFLSSFTLLAVSMLFLIEKFCVTYSIDQRKKKEKNEWKIEEFKKKLNQPNTNRIMCYADLSGFNTNKAISFLLIFFCLSLAFTQFYWFCL